MVTEVSSPRRPASTSSRVGSFGALPAEVATPLAMVLTEVLQNAVEHGFGREGGPAAARSRWPRAARSGRLHVTVDDDGVGLPDGLRPRTRSTSLGLSIVRTLVESELGGQLRDRAAGRDGAAPGWRSTYRCTSPAGSGPGRAQAVRTRRGRCGASGRGARPR